MTVGNFACGRQESRALCASARPDRLRLLATKLPRPLRFLGVGGLGLLTDITLFTLILMHWPHPLFARALSLSAATFVTWRLNRALTFDRSGHRQTQEAMRYAAVTTAAQGTSYAVFAVLTYTVFTWLPQAALLAGAAVGALISYNGHRLFDLRAARRVRPRPSFVNQQVVLPMSVDVEVFVIGAGPAGLTAAYCLTKEMPSVVVIEKDPVYVGGISRTVRYKDFLFDIGGHRFFSKAKEVVDLWQEILPDDFIERPRLSRIFYGGKYYSYPLSAFEALANLGIVKSAACMLSFAYAKAFPIADARTFHDWVRNQFGEKLFSIFFKTYTEKVWGMSCDEISADWAAQRIKGLDLGVAVMNALKRAIMPRAGKRKAGEPVVKTLIESFQYPRKGPGMMWEAAARKIMKRGGKVLMGRELQKLAYDCRQEALAHRGLNRRRRLRGITLPATSSARRRCAS